MSEFFTELADVRLAQDLADDARPWDGTKFHREAGDVESPNLFDRVTQSILRQLESGVPPWVKPWAMGNGAHMPFNAETRRAYNGINTLLLWAESAFGGFTSPGWVTLKQIKEAGCHLKRKPDAPPGRTGQEATMIVYWGTHTRERTKSSGEASDETYRFLKRHHVFSVDQVEDPPERWVVPEKPVPSIDEGLISSRDYVAVLNANVIRAPGAFYSSTRDVIGMPPTSAFVRKADGDMTKAAAHYQATLLHELGHWTGHSARCDRKLGNVFGGVNYAKEELVAEIFSAFQCAKFGLPAQLQHASYIKSWMQVLREDNRAIFHAASAAKKAVDWCDERARDVLYPTPAIAAE